MADDKRTAQFESCFGQLSKESKEYIFSVMRALSAAQDKEEQELSSRGKKSQDRPADNAKMDQDDEKLKYLIGERRFAVLGGARAVVEELYDMELTCRNFAGKKWDYEFKYRRGGRTLCAFYAARDSLGFMVILGKNERAKFAAERDNFSAVVRELYDATETFHDGKWLMLPLEDESLFSDLERLLLIKRKPNRCTS